MQEQENTSGEGQTQASLFRAAEYVRMSTEHQQYSTENQADKIREYAARRGIEIIKTYTDAGRRCNNLSRMSKPGRRTSRSSWSTTSAAGVASRMPMRVLTTSTSAVVPAFRSLTVPSSSRTMAHRPRSRRYSMSRLKVARDTSSTSRNTSIGTTRRSWSIWSIL